MVLTNKGLEPNEIAYAGFLILKLSDMQNLSSSAPFTHAEVQELSIDFHDRAFKHSKANPEEIRLLSDNTRVVAQETIDLKYSAKLIYAWATKNEKISPKDALYIGFLLHAKYQILTGRQAATLATDETLNQYAQAFHAKAEQHKAAKSSKQRDKYKGYTE